MNPRGSGDRFSRWATSYSLVYILINVLANKSLGGGLFGVAGGVSALLDIESGSDGWGRTMRLRARRVSKIIAPAARHIDQHACNTITLFTPARRFSWDGRRGRATQFQRELTAHVCHSLATAPITGNKKVRSNLIVWTVSDVELTLAFYSHRTSDPQHWTRLGSIIYKAFKQKIMLECNVSIFRVSRNRYRLQLLLLDNLESYLELNHKIIF